MKSLKTVDGQRGFTLIEVLITVALMGIVFTGFLLALSTASKANLLTDTRATAESLARSQLENVKQQVYIIAPDGGEATYSKIDAGDIPEGFTIQTIDGNGDPVDDIIGVPWDSENYLPIPVDGGLQRIVVIVSLNGEMVLTLESYKVNR